MNKKFTLFVVLALTMLLVACGGGAVDTSAIDAANATIAQLEEQVAAAEGALCVLPGANARRLRRWPPVQHARGL